MESLPDCFNRCADVSYSFEVLRDSACPAHRWAAPDAYLRSVFVLLLCVLGARSPGEYPPGAGGTCRYTTRSESNPSR